MYILFFNSHEIIELDRVLKHIYFLYVLLTLEWILIMKVNKKQQHSFTISAKGWLLLRLARLFRSLEYLTVEIRIELQINTTDFFPSH